MDLYSNLSFLSGNAHRQLTLRGSLNPSLNKLARNKRDTDNVSFLIATSSDWLGLAAAAAAAAFAASAAITRVRFDRFFESK